MLLASFASMVITAIHNFLLSNGMEIMGSGALVFSAVIFLIALGLWLYARTMARAEVLR